MKIGMAEAPRSPPRGWRGAGALRYAPPMDRLDSAAALRGLYAGPRELGREVAASYS